MCRVQCPERIGKRGVPGVTRMPTRSISVRRIRMLGPGLRATRVTAAVATGSDSIMAAPWTTAVTSTRALRTATVAVTPTPTAATASLTVRQSDFSGQDMRPTQSERRGNKRAARQQCERQACG